MFSRPSDLEQNANASPDPVGAEATGLEEAARALLNQRRGQALSDQEWARVRANLLEFLKILRTWSQSVENGQVG
jgi:hypothetical protein